jgi:hypothetical protein
MLEKQRPRIDKAELLRALIGRAPDVLGVTAWSFGRRDHHVRIIGRSAQSCSANGMQRDVQVTQDCYRAMDGLKNGIDELAVGCGIRAKARQAERLLVKRVTRPARHMLGSLPR